MPDLPGPREESEDGFCFGFARPGRSRTLRRWAFLRAGLSSFPLSGGRKIFFICAIFCLLSPFAARAGTRKAEAPGMPVAQKLLASAGRDPRAAQPEKNFLLEAPDYAYDGEAIVLRFGAEGAQSVILELGGKRLRISGSSGRQSGFFEALLPVALGAAAPSLPLSLKIVWEGGKEEVMHASLPLKRRSYPVQKLTVEGRFVSPPPEMEEKIKKDRAEIRAAVGRTSRTRNWRLPMARPVPGDVTSLYGSRRVFNGVPKNPHKGTDFDAKEGEPVRAVAAGEVVLASEHYYGGNTILVDHGLGVVSAYLHLSAFEARPGQKVERGEVIGLAGSTGRVTGPHLHLSLYVLGESVNAEPCLEPAPDASGRGDGKSGARGRGSDL